MNENKVKNEITKFIAHNKRCQIVIDLIEASKINDRNQFLYALEKIKRAIHIKQKIVVASAEIELLREKIKLHKYELDKEMNDGYITKELSLIEEMIENE